MIGRHLFSNNAALPCQDTASSRRAWRLAIAGFTFATVLAGAIRFTRLDYLTLRIDELYTLLYSRQSWTDVAGLNGYYDSHPPLFFTLTKAAAAIVGDELGGRFISAFFGFLTIPLIFVLVTRMLDARAGFVAALLLAVAPMHIESSRDGRMFTAVIFFVLVSYAALVEYLREPRWLWAVMYGGSLSLSIYLDYTALYPLVFQTPLLIFALIRHPRQRLILIACTAAAVLSYVPWLPQLRETIDALSRYSDDSGRDVYLGASWSAISASIPYVLGLDGRGSSVRGYENVWVRWPDAHIPLLIVVIAIAAAGVILMRNRPAALVITLSLALGAPFTAIAISLFSPAYANRTVQIAVVGWCIAVGWLVSCLWNAVVPIGRLAATGIVVLLLGSAAITVPATLSSAGRYEWRAASEFLIAHNQQNYPVILLSNTGTLTDALTLYGGDELADQPIITITDGVTETYLLAGRWIDRGLTRKAVSDGALVPLLPLNDQSVGAVWFASRQGEGGVRAALEALGYREVLGIRFIRGDLWLFLRPFAVVGTVRDINGEFARGEVLPDGWETEGGQIRIAADGSGGRDLILPGDGESRSATYRVSDAVTGIYTFTVQAKSSAASTLATTIRCVDSGARERASTEDVETFTEAGSPAVILIAVQCPNRSPSVELTLTASGEADIVLERVMLTESPGPPL